MKYIIGIDEVGRGPLAGPVTVGVVVCESKTYAKLKKSKNLPQVGKDSKKLKPVEREIYAKYIKTLVSENFSFSVIHVSNKIIDKKGISFCIKKAMKVGLEKLKEFQKYEQCDVRLDGGLKAPAEFTKQKTIIKGDEKEKIIAWASILAKVSRDRLMVQVSKKFPEYKKYNFDVHKGYGTLKHRQAIKKHGLSGFHRVSFCKKLVLERALDY